MTERFAIRLVGGPTPTQDVVVANWPPPDRIEVDGNYDGYYVKTNQSQITDADIKSMKHVMRGAEYRWKDEPWLSNEAMIASDLAYDAAREKGKL